MTNKLQMAVGFMFSEDRQKVALIKKNSPKWQKGLLNGIGGKKEYKELLIETMVREFHEETGYITKSTDWIPFAFMSGETWEVTAFHAVGSLEQLRSTTEEEVVIVRLSDFTNKSFFPMISNLYWLVPMALDHLSAKGQFYTTINYL